LNQQGIDMLIMNAECYFLNPEHILYSICQDSNLFEAAGIDMFWSFTAES